MIRGVLGAVIALAPLSSVAGVSMYLAEAEYWSHTNNRASCLAMTYGTTEGIVAWRVLIGEDMPYHFDGIDNYLLFGISMPDVSPVVVFDSTLWPHLTDLEVKFEVITTDDLNTWVTVSHSCYVKNIAGLFSDPTLKFAGKDALVSGYEAMNYDTMVREDEWDYVDYFQDIQHMTAADLNVHGNTMSHKDGNTNPSITFMTFAELIDTGNQSVEPIEQKIGSGLPPFNSTHWPPFQFVHLNSCNCGERTEWAGYLHPNKNTYSANLVEDQALLAYTVYTYDDFHDEMSIALMNILTQGYAVHFGRQNIYIQGETFVSDEEGGEFRLVALADITLLGDSTTRLTTVHTGTLASPASDDLGEPKRHFRLEGE